MSNSRMLQNWASLYANQTDAERAIEPAIASLGVPYRFQHPVWAAGCFPDFVLVTDRLVIEVDDVSHATTAKRRSDAERTGRLARAGWRVVRCTNADALEDPYATVDRLMSEAGLQHRTQQQHPPAPRR